MTLTIWGRLTSINVQKAMLCIEEAGVATTPGIDFGDNAPDRHLRIAYTTEEPRLVEAAERIARVLRTR